MATAAPDRWTFPFGSKIEPGTRRHEWTSKGLWSSAWCSAAGWSDGIFGWLPFLYAIVKNDRSFPALSRYVFERAPDVVLDASWDCHPSLML